LISKFFRPCGPPQGLSKMFFSSICGFNVQFDKVHGAHHEYRGRN